MPKHSDRSVFYLRKFLNKPRYHAGAYLLASITREEYRNKDGETTEIYYSTDLRISDCDRIVSLSLDDGDRADRANTMHKLDTLIDGLVRFRAALAKAHAEIEANNQ